MPSASLINWQTVRMPCLREVDGQCSATQVMTPPNARLAEENIRGYVVLLSAHFQGFCRDLYTESAQIVAKRVRTTLRILVQEQFTAHCTLDYGNPNHHNLRRDFSRFQLRLDLPLADPANATRLQHLASLNTWRNIAAHHGIVPPGGLPTLSELQAWSLSCDGLAVSLDSIMYNHLRRLLRRSPWPP